MSRNITCMQLDAQVHERLAIKKVAVSESLLYNGNSVGLQVMLCLLMDHWDKSPPDLVWLREQLELYPKRGRPRRSAPTDMGARVALRRSVTKGHDLFTSRKFRGFKVFCKNCDLVHFPNDTHDGKPDQSCPTVVGVMSIYAPKRWTRKELIEKWKFEVDEVQWLPEDPPQP